MTKAKTPKHVVYFRRRREGATNYSKRLALVKGRTTRMVVRKSNSGIIVQFIDFAPQGDVTRLTVTSAKLKKLYSWPSRRNTLTAYLTGLLGGHEVKKKNIKEFILDIGMHMPTKGSVLFAALKGAVDAGLKTGYDESIVPMGKLSNPKSELKSAFEDTKKKILAG